MSNRPARLRSSRMLGFLVLICIVAIGCTTTRTIPIAAASGLSSSIHPGDKITIVKTGGEEVRMEVSAVSNTGISGGGQTIDFSDMQEIRVREIDGEKTELLVKISGGVIIGYFALRELAKGLQSIPAY